MLPCMAMYAPAEPAQAAIVRCELQHVRLKGFTRRRRASDRLHNRNVAAAVSFRLPLGLALHQELWHRTTPHVPSTSFTQQLRTLPAKATQKQRKEEQLELRRQRHCLPTMWRPPPRRLAYRGSCRLGNRKTTSSASASVIFLPPAACCEGHQNGGTATGTQTCASAHTTVCQVAR